MMMSMVHIDMSRYCINMRIYTFNIIIYIYTLFSRENAIGRLCTYVLEYIHTLE